MFYRNETTYNITGFRGVHFEPSRQKYKSEFHHNNERFRGPRRDSAEEAAMDYDRMAIDKVGSAAVLNFPLSGEREAKILKSPPSYAAEACSKGHPFPRALYLLPDGRWFCRDCNAVSVARYKSKNREAVARRKREYKARRRARLCTAT